MILGTCLHCKKDFRKRVQKQKFCSLICSNNFNKNGLKKIYLPALNVQLAEFVGICLGDGCITKYQTSVTLNTNADRDYIPYVANLMRDLFSTSEVKSIYRKGNATDVRVNSVVVANFLKDMGIISNKKIIPSWIFSSMDYKKACVKGLIDTEGSISFKKYLSKKGKRFYRQLNFRNTDIHFMKFVRDTLLSIGLKPTMSLKKSLYISNDEDIKKYAALIGFGNPKLVRKSTICEI